MQSEGDEWKCCHITQYIAMIMVVLESGLNYCYNMAHLC